MLLYYYEKKGLLVLLLLIVALIVIPRQIKHKKTDAFLLQTPHSIADSIRMAFPAEQEPIELNSADSATLVQIRGIGPYYAAKIIRYRERLSGYYRTEQLKELRLTYFNVDSSAHLFTVNPGLIRKKDLNTLTFKEVLRHPYLEYEDVKLIFNAKNKYKKISMDTLEKRKILPVYKLKKIKPYFM